MNCKTAQKQAALYVGGDLPDQDISNLMKHLETCGECSKEFETLKHSCNVVKDIAQKDIQEPLQADFSQMVLDRIKVEQTSREPRLYKIIDFFRLRPTVVLVAAVCAVIVYLGISHIMLQRKIRQLAQRLEKVQEIVQRDRAEIEVSDNFLSARSIEGPLPLDEWELSDTPGIFAILHKPDPVNKPGTYIIDYLGETGGAQTGDAAWIKENRERILKRAGSEDNIYIAVYHMPRSSESLRTMIVGFFINRHKPYFNNGV